MVEGQAYWDTQAATYDRATAWIEPRLLAPAREWVAQRVRGHTLEVAAGTGANLPYLRGRYELVVWDSSGALLAEARGRARDLGVDVTAVQADASRLPWPDAHFDTVVCTFALCCVPDEVAVLREPASVVHPQGAVLLADHVESSAWLGRLVQRGLDVGQALGPVPRVADTRTRHPEGPMAERPPDDIRAGVLVLLAAVCALPVVACLGAVRDAAGVVVASPLLAAAAATFVG
ncbi:MAG: class I SAM-dependent methyltransferase [Cellulomonas sp.]|nr:class I SAM-dependent methyltransferase [Cellulomonas sp.]MCR6648512.1 class I SAM-dependent methyltransferase [Cellulomonas sp.]